MNCNFLRSVLLRSNEAFKLVDGVKLIFKIIIGSKDSQEGTTTRSGFSLLFLFPEFFLGSRSNPDKSASPESNCIQICKVSQQKGSCDKTLSSSCFVSHLLFSCYLLVNLRISFFKNYQKYQPTLSLSHTLIALLVLLAFQINFSNFLTFIKYFMLEIAFIIVNLP